MTETPQIETDRLRICPFSEEYLTDAYVSWLNDLEVVRYSQQRFRENTLEGCRENWQSFQSSPNHFWAIEIPQEEAYIGTITAYVDEPYGVADVGILIGERSKWGKGYGTEAFSGVVVALLEAFDMRKVTAGTVELNQGMLGIMENIGMTDDGRRRRQALIDGKEVDVVHKALFDDQADALCVEDQSVSISFP
jgi:RimJ/RimL family protein N-acetyltransferase